MKSEPLLKLAREALHRCALGSVIEGADQGDPNAESIERSQALDALADIRGIARNALRAIATTSTEDQHP